MNSFPGFDLNQIPSNNTSYWKYHETLRVVLSDGIGLLGSLPDESRQFRRFDVLPKKPFFKTPGQTAGCEAGRMFLWSVENSDVFVTIS